MLFRCILPLNATACHSPSVYPRPERTYFPSHLNLNGNIDLKPLARYSNNVNGPREYTYGGAVEIGLQLVLHTHWRYQPYFEVNGGTMMFTRNIPTADTRRVTLCIDFTPGF